MRRCDAGRAILILLVSGGTPALAASDELVQRPVQTTLIAVASDTELPAWLTTISLGFAGAITAASPLAAAPRSQDAAANGSWAARIVDHDATARKGLLTTGSVAKAPRRDRAELAATEPRLSGDTHAMTGVASYYWQNQKTATGEQFNKRDLTAAHKTLPFGTRVRVTRVDTGNSVVVRINDRGPFKPGRVIDLSERAAEDLDMTGRGLTKVRLEVLSR